LFIELYKTLGPSLEKLLVGQKQAVVDKLIKEAKKQCGDVVRSDSQREEQKKAATNYISSQVKSDYLPEYIVRILGQATVELLKSANPKKRQKGLVEVKKAVSKLTVNLNDKKARELADPITHLMRQILSDESSEVYLEALKIVRYIISSLAPHLGALDLHILIGSFIGIIVSNTVSSNIRIQVSSDKVIIFFAKHSNIGPLVVARDIVKNIEKISQAIQRSGNKKEVFSEKKSFLTRFLSILLLLVNQFSIVLCYEEDFNDKMIACLAELVENSDSDPNIKSLVSQILAACHSIDSQTLTVSINKLDPIKKAPLLKIKIEMETMMKSGNAVITAGGKNTFANSDMTSHTPPFRITSGRNSSRGSVYSPANPPTLSHQNTFDSNSDQFKSSDGFRSSDGFKSELKGSRRLLQKKGSGMDYAQSSRPLIPVRRSSQFEQNSLTEKKIPDRGVRRSQIAGSGISKFSLPDIAPKGNNVLPPIAGTSGLGTYQPPSMSSSSLAGGRRPRQTQREKPLADSINRPPIYRKAAETVREGSKFNDDGMSGGYRYGPTSQTQTDFGARMPQMNSSVGMGSNMNTIMTGSTIPQAKFEISTTNYDNKAPRVKRDALDGEINRFNMR